MEDWIKFSYISHCRYGLSFCEYKINWNAKYPYNYEVANDVVRRMKNPKPFLGSKFVIKEIDKYLVK